MPPSNLNAPNVAAESTPREQACSNSPGTPNALFARVIEDLGFEGVYVTGAGIANMSLGVPDIGLVLSANW